MRNRVHVTTAAKAVMTVGELQTLDEIIPSGTYLVVALHGGMLESDLYVPDGNLHRAYASHASGLIDSTVRALARLLPNHIS